MLKNNTGIENLGENNSGNRNSGGGGGNGNRNSGDQSHAQWFIDRIGKRIYRDPSKCCAHCDAVAKNGLIISDETHAIYLSDMESALVAEGTSPNYRDKK